MTEDDNLAISDGDRLPSGDELDGMCEYLQSQYVLDAFFSVSGGKLFDPDSGISESIGCEVGELESWISDGGASRHMTSSHDSTTNYREYSRNVRTTGGDVHSRLKVLGTLSFAFCLTQELLTFSHSTFRLYHNWVTNSCDYSILQPSTIHWYKNGVELQVMQGRTL